MFVCVMGQVCVLMGESVHLDEVPGPPWADFGLSHLCLMGESRGCRAKGGECLQVCVHCVITLRCAV